VSGQRRAQDEAMIMSGEDLKILAGDLLDFLNALEASCVKLRQQIDKLFGPEKPLKQTK
jgi:hypothetical protein